MGHTNSTTNYGLPQFLTSDKPAWLTDINNAMSDIDTAIHNAQSDATTAGNNATQALSDASAASTAAAAADAKGAGALASIESTFDPTTIYSVGAKVIYNSLLYRCTVAVVTPGPWTGSDNWERITVDNLISTTDSKIGQLTSLSTTDKSSVVNAINEVNGTKQSSTWTLQGTATGTNEVPLPATWNEMLIYGQFGGNANYGFTAYMIHAKTGLPNKFINGGGVPNDQHQILWHYYNTGIGIDTWKYNNTDYTSTSSIEVYYR